MLPAAHRLRHSVDFERAVRRGVRGGRKTLVVHLFLEPIAPGPALVGFVVSKAVGNAVTRNLVKRRLRAIIASRLEQLMPGTTAVLRALPAAAAADFAGLADDVDAGFAAASRRWSQRQGDARMGVVRE